MPSYPKVSKDDYKGQGLTDEQVEAKLNEISKDLWDLINFVLAMPYPHMLPKDVRDAIYPPGQEASCED